MSHYKTIDAANNLELDSGTGKPAAREFACGRPWRLAVLTGRRCANSEKSIIKDFSVIHPEKFLFYILKSYTSRLPR
jgi:hypothetical protein